MAERPTLSPFRAILRFVEYIVLWNALLLQGFLSCKEKEEDTDEKKHGMN